MTLKSDAYQRIFSESENENQVQQKYEELSMTTSQIRCRAQTFKGFIIEIDISFLSDIAYVTEMNTSVSSSIFREWSTLRMFDNELSNMW